MKAKHKRYIQSGIATEENIVSVIHDEIQQRNPLSNCSLRTGLLNFVLFAMIGLMFIIYWTRYYGGNTERPTKLSLDDSLVIRNRHRVSENPAALISYSRSSISSSIIIILLYILLCFISIIIIKLRGLGRKRRIKLA